jgi:DNA-binding transcriptional MocR family regulator
VVSLNNGPIYLEIANALSRLICGGSLRSGDPLPSVRVAALQHRVSKGTVIQAYAALEAQGLIEAKPQSGFYVRSQAQTGQPLPQTSLKRPSVVRSGRGIRVRNTLGDLVSSRATSLGSAFPDPSLFPLGPLNRALATSGRQSQYAKTGDDLQLGLLVLRRVIAHRYLELGYAVPLEEIVITCGGTEAISLSLQAVAKPGDLILIDSPMFFSGIQLMEQLGLGAIEMPTDPLSGLDLGLLDKTLDRYRVAACLLMTNCQNPLGFCMDEAKKQALVQILARRGIPLVENDVYAELQFTVRHSRAAKAFDSKGLVLHCGSFTKSLAPGYKVGWVAPGRFREAVVDRKFATTLGTSVPPQAALALYLQQHSYDRHLRTLRRTLGERVRQMQEVVEKYFPSDTRVSRPQGGYVLWVQLPDGVDSFALFERAGERGIAVAPGPIFSVSRGYRNFVRLNCSHPWTAELEGTLRWLGDCAATLN